MGTNIKNPKKCLCADFTSTSERGKFRCFSCSNFNKNTDECNLYNAPFISSKSNFIQDPYEYTCNNFKDNISKSKEVAHSHVCINCIYYSINKSEEILPYCFNPNGIPSKIECNYINDPENMICSEFTAKSSHNKTNCCSSCIHYQKKGCDNKNNSQPEYLLESAKKTKITSPPEKTLCKSFIPKDSNYSKSRCSECFYFNKDDNLCEDNRTVLGVPRNHFPSFIKVEDVCSVEQSKNYICDDFCFNFKCRTYCKSPSCFNCNNYIKDKNSFKFSGCIKSGISSPSYRNISNPDNPKKRKRILYRIKPSPISVSLRNNKKT